MDPTYDPNQADFDAPLGIAPRECHLLVITTCEGRTAVHSHASLAETAAFLADLAANAYAQLDAGPIQVPPPLADQLRAAGWIPPIEAGATE